MKIIESDFGTQMMEGVFSLLKKTCLLLKHSKLNRSKAIQEIYLLLENKKMSMLLIFIRWWSISISSMILKDAKAAYLKIKTLLFVV